MFSTWALRARSYKNKTEAWHQAQRAHPLQGVDLGFCLNIQHGDFTTTDYAERADMSGRAHVKAHYVLAII